MEGKASPQRVNVKEGRASRFWACPLLLKLINYGTELWSSYTIFTQPLS